jgi:hypothetical protein
MKLEFLVGAVICFTWSIIIASTMIPVPPPIVGIPIISTQTEEPTQTQEPTPTLIMATETSAVMYAEIILNTPEPEYVPELIFNAQSTQIPELIFYYDTPLPQMTEFIYVPENPIVEIPTPVILPEAEPDLDTAWDSVESFGMTGDWPSCTYPLPMPFVTWDMAYRLSNLQAGRSNCEEISISSAVIANIYAEGGGYFPADGNIRLPENNVLGMLLPYYTSGQIQVCQDASGKPSVYGQGINLFLDDLYKNYKE